MNRSDKLMITVREVLRKKARSSQVRPGGLQIRLMDLSGLDSIALKEGMCRLREVGEVSAQGWDENHCMPTTMMTLNLAPIPEDEHATQWREVVQDSNLSEEGKDALKMIVNKVKDLSKDDQRRLVASIQRLIRGQRELPLGISRYEASARHLLSSSKILDALGDSLLSALGFDPACVASPPKYVAVAGPSSPIAVVLVENPHSFETAASLDTGCAWACTYGFGLSLDRDERRGAMLVENLTTHIKSVKRLVRSGAPPQLDDLLEHPRLLFWGDLDLAGLDIFQRLKAKIPNLQLSALYHPMAEIIRMGGGHPYVACVGKEKQQARYSSHKWNSNALKQLATICAERAVDQEAISQELIVELCERAYC